MQTFLFWVFKIFSELTYCLVHGLFLKINRGYLWRMYIFFLLDAEFYLCPLVQTCSLCCSNLKYYILFILILVMHRWLFGYLTHLINFVKISPTLSLNIVSASFPIFPLLRYQYHCWQFLNFTLFPIVYSIFSFFFFLVSFWLFFPLTSCSLNLTESGLSLNSSTRS